MKTATVVNTWLWFSLEDLYFSFCTDYEQHRHYSLFAEFMALEKTLKAFLLFNSSDKYANLHDNEARDEIESLVNKYSHSIKAMLKEISRTLNTDELSKLKEKTYGNYTGTELINAIDAGYMKSKYPVSRPIYEQFRANGTNVYQNPIGSSFITDFIYELIRFILTKIRYEIDLSHIKSDFINLYGSREQTQRFIKIVFKGNIDEYL